MNMINLPDIESKERAVKKLAFVYFIFMVSISTVIVMNAVTFSVPVEFLSSARTYYNFLYSSSIVFFIITEYYLWINRANTVEEKFSKYNKFKLSSIYSMKAFGECTYPLVGAILFGVMTITKHVIKIVSTIYHLSCQCCVGEIVVHRILAILFIICQTSFFVRRISIVFIRHAFVICFCLIHIQAVNVSTWLFASSNELIKHSNYSDLMLGGEKCGVNDFSEWGNILSPFQSEYSIVMIGIISIILLRTGNMDSIDLSKREEKPHISFWRRFKKDKCLTFCVLLTILIFLFSFSLQFVDEELVELHKRYFIIFLTSEHYLLTIVNIISAWRLNSVTKKMKYTVEKYNYFLDKGLLFTALFFNFIFIMGKISSLSGLTKKFLFYDLHNIIILARIILCLLELMQFSYLTHITTDAFHRCCWDEAQVKEEIGKYSLYALIFANASMWFVQSIQFEKFDLDVHIKKSHQDDKPAIKQIVNIFKPFNLLFRFHICVCLADILKNLYELPETRAETFLKLKRGPIHRLFKKDQL